MNDRDVEDFDPGRARFPPPGWPQISDYWPDAPRRTKPAAAPPSSGTPAEPIRWIVAPPRRSSPWLLVLLATVAAVALLGGSAIALVRIVGKSDGAASQDLTAAPAPPAQVTSAPPSPSPSTATSAQPSATKATPARSTASAVPPFETATFEIDGNMTALTVTVAGLGADPVRATTPPGSGLKPRTTVDGRTVRITVASDGTKGSGRLTVRLNQRVAWSLRINSGMSSADYLLAGAKLRRIDVTGGAARMDMALPPISGTLPITMSGGVSAWHITTVRKSSVRVRAEQGGAEAVLDGHRTDGIARGTTLRNGSAPFALDIDAIAGFASLTVAS